MRGQISKMELKIFLMPLNQWTIILRLKYCRKRYDLFIFYTPFFLQEVAYTWPLPTLVHYCGITLLGKMVIYVHLVINPESM